QGGTSTTTLTVTITGTNDRSVISGPDIGAVTEDATLSTGGQLLASDVDGPAQFIAASTPGAYGSFSIDAAGNWVYTLNNPDPAVQSLGANDVRIERFTVSTTDGSTQTVTITVNGANEAPTATGTTVSGVEDAPSIPVTLGGGDVDGSVVSFMLANLPTNGTLYLDAAMTQPVVPGSVLPATAGGLTLHFKPNANWNGSTGFQFSATDDQGASSTPATATINVTAVNDNPIAADNRGSVLEDATLSMPPSNGLIASALDLAGKDTDVEGDPLTVVALRTGAEAASGTRGSVGSPLAGTYGSLTVDTQGSYTYVADRATALAAGVTATDTFTYTISDGHGGTDTAELVITITGTNDTPVQVGTLPGVAGTDAQPVSIPTAAGFADPDTGDTLAFTATGLPPGLGIDPVTGLITGTLASDASVSGPYPITVTVTDRAGAQTTQTFTLTVTNPAPTANPDTLALTENDTQGGNLLTGIGIGGDEADIDPDADTLVVTRAGAGSTLSTDVTAAGTVIAGLHGSLTLKADGSYTYTATDDALADGQTATDTFTYTVSDGQGGTSTTTLTVTITGTNDAPVVQAAAINLSEEALGGGEPDSLGTIDTTNDAISSGVLTLSDAEGSALGVTLSAPAGSLSSGGVPITWSGSGTQALIGSAGGVEILRATIDDQGRYTVRLSGPIDHPDTRGEDARSIELGVNVSDGSATTRGTISVTLEDDAPQAAEISQSIEVAPMDTNLLLTLDVSGSMLTNDGINGASRLDAAISALNQLLDSYDNLGEVRVRLVTFSSRSAILGTEWTSVAEAKNLLSTLETGGATNYDAALSAAQSAFTTPGKLASGQNIAYFLSDGIPSIDLWHVSPAEEASWKGFLSTNQITSFALGMGSNADQGPLNPIAYNGATNTELDGQVITDFNKLASALQTTIPPTASGEIVAGGLYNTGFGADGGHVSSITVDGVTYTPDTSLGTLNTSGGASAATYDAASNQIRVLTATGGALVLDFDTGSYTYTPLSTVSTNVINDGFTYVLTDNDGDSASSRVLFAAQRAVESTLTLTSPQQVSGTSGNDSITGSSGNDTILGGAGNDIIKGAGGVDLIAGGAGHDTLSGGAGADTFKWSLGDAGTAAAPAVDAITDFSTAAASSGGDILDLRDLLQGESHTGNLAGNLGSYLHFEKIGADTVLNISSTGGHTSGNYSTTDQKLVLQGVDLTGLGTDTQIIQNLLANGKLNTD
ncbi:Ig-like domain-containing protein, partial [uncultured Zoogloea sp.]|uniref:VCBS domain-containing protein n=1 Tax=uncultured Zoogloea sp. TaxID=160237 RepID=UPI0026119D85